MHEDGAVFGATNRVEEAVDVLLMRYPEVKVVPIISTCSTEVIGDDIDGVVTKLNSGLLKEKYPGREVHLIAIHTPSFVGSMISGYDVAVRDIITHFAEKGEPNGKLNLVTGWVNPGDVKALKHLLIVPGVHKRAGAVVALQVSDAVVIAQIVPLLDHAGAPLQRAAQRVHAHVIIQGEIFSDLIASLSRLETPDRRN